MKVGMIALNTVSGRNAAIVRIYARELLVQCMLTDELMYWPQCICLVLGDTTLP